MIKENINKAANIIDNMNIKNNVKHIKSEKGLIERVELKKTILTEDNKMLLND
jgi:hypothetical protein